MQKQSVESGYLQYSESLKESKANFKHYPRVVSIETYVKCNASCTFCPYPKSPRKGERLSDALFYKIIDDLTAIPKSHQYLLTLARINEPLLDKRLQSFSRHIDTNLTNASQIMWSNGSTIVKNKFEWIGEIKNSTLVISLNSIDDKMHKKLMGFGLENVIKNLDYLHKLKEQNQFSSNVVLNAPYQSGAMSVEFSQFCKNKWPLFAPNIMPFFTWQGDWATGENEKLSSRFFEHITTDISKLGCGQWFDIHILANGQITKCCIDEAGFTNKTHNVDKNHVLELYNYSQQLRDNLPHRGQIESCRQCTHLG